MVNDADVAQLIDSLKAGNLAARESLINLTLDRLRFLTRKIFHANFDRIRRWEETDDVFNTVILKLNKSLETNPPENSQHFYSTASTIIRNTLTDLSRRYYGPQGRASLHSTKVGVANDPDSSLEVEQLDVTHEAVSILDWGDFHEQVGKLPAELQETFELVFYHGFSIDDVARHMNKSPRQIRRYWLNARTELYRVMQGLRPGVVE